MSKYYTAPVVNWSSGGRAVFTPSQFMQKQSKRMGRQVIEEFIFTCSLSLTTGAGVSMAAPDFASFVKELRITNNRGLRRRGPMSGAEARAWSLMELGSKAPNDDVALAQNLGPLVRTFTLVVPMALKKARRGPDTALPVDMMLDGGNIEIDMPKNTELLATGGNPTINAGVTSFYSCTVKVREEFDVEFHTEDQVEMDNQPSAAQALIPVGNRWVRSVTLYTQAAGGGTDVTGVTAVTSVPYDMSNIPAAALVAAYKLESIPHASDPVAAGLALPLISPRSNAKASENYRFTSDLLFTLANTGGALRTIKHTYVARDTQTTDIQAATNGVDANKAHTKTASKGSNKDPKSHGALGAVLPAKVKVR